MEFVNRNAQQAGKIKLTKQDNSTEICTVELYDNANPQGTPLNKETFDQFKEDILDAVEQFNGVKNALTYGQSINVGSSSNLVNATLNLALSDFNRTPIVGETFVGVLYANENGQKAHEKSCIGTFRITQMDESNNSCRAVAVGHLADTTGVGISGISYSGQDVNGGNVYSITLTNNAKINFTAPKGLDGSRGEKGDKGDKGDRGEKGEAGSGVYLSSESFTTGVGRYDVSSVAYNKTELCAGDLILSTSSRNIVRVRSLTSDGFVFIGEYVLSL